MKKSAFALILFMIFVMGCTENEPGIIEISENMFITQIDNINLNYRDYVGKTIKLEGFFVHNFWEGNNWFFVVRNTPDCCGEGSVVGFEVSWDPDYQGTNRDTDLSMWPETDEWVEAIGTLTHFEFMGNRVFLALSELNVLETRGQSFVFR